jgi:protein SCO1/2
MITGTRGLLFMVSLLLVATMVACNKHTAENTSQGATKHYHLKGKVISIDQRAKMINLDSEAIPGFMDAMTMPYKVKPDGQLDKLHSGDAITADLLVQDEGAWLEHVAVMGHSDVPGTK